MEHTSINTTFPKYPMYKDSGVEWIGEIPEGWEVKPLFSEVKLRSEDNHIDEELLSVYLDKGVIRFKDVTAKRTNVTSTDLCKYQLVEIGDFVLNNQQAWRGSVGVSRFRGIVSPAYLVLELSKRIDRKFANYMFRNQHMVSQYLKSSKGVGTIQRNLYYPQLKRSDLLLPTLSEQTAIANFLDEKTAKIDQAIAQKEHLIELLKERKQIIIQNAVTKGIDPNVQLKDSGKSWIGKIPSHWRTEKGKWLFVKNERPIRSSDEIITCFRDGQVTLRSNRRTGGFTNALKEHGYQGIRKGDLVIHAMDAFAGAIGVSDSDGKSTPVYSACTERVKKSVNQYYYAYFLRSLAFNGVIVSLAKGIRERSTDFRFSDFGDLTLTFPPLSEQIAIANFLDEKTAKIDNIINIQQTQIEKLKEFKASLIDSAVTGKINVSGHD